MNKKARVIIFATLLIALGLLGYTQYEQASRLMILESEQKPTGPKEQLPRARPLDERAPTEDTTQGNAPLQPQQTSLDPQIPIIIMAEGSIPKEDGEALRSRWAEPFIMYSKDNAQPVASVTIKRNLEPSKDEFPYLFDGVYISGAYFSSVITKTDGQIDWWRPECMGKCPLSAEFTVKYPEIVKILEGM